MTAELQCSQQQWLVMAVLLLVPSAAVNAVVGPDAAPDCTVKVKCDLPLLDCDGTSIDHIPFQERLKVNLSGIWGLSPIESDTLNTSQREDYSPTQQSRTSRAQSEQMEAVLWMTRVAPCVLQLDLQQQEAHEAITYFIGYHKGHVVELCGRSKDSGSHYSALTTAFGVAAAVQTTAPHSDPHDNTILEGGPTTGSCYTHYTRQTLAPKHNYFVTKKTDLTRCTEFPLDIWRLDKLHARQEELVGYLADEATLTCSYEFYVDGDARQEQVKHEREGDDKDRHEQSDRHEHEEHERHAHEEHDRSGHKLVRHEHVEHSRHGRNKHDSRSERVHERQDKKQERGAHEKHTRRSHDTAVMHGQTKRAPQNISDSENNSNTISAGEYRDGSRVKRAERVARIECVQQVRFGSTYHESRLALHFEEGSEQLVQYWGQDEAADLYHINLPHSPSHSSNSHKVTASTVPQIKGELRKLCQINVNLEAEGAASDYSMTFLTSSVGVVYPRLLSLTESASEGTLFQVYQQVAHGELCSDEEGNERVRTLLSSALRDATSSSSAVAVCKMLLEERFRSLHDTFLSIAPWVTFLSHKQPPSGRDLVTCTKILETPRWEHYILDLTVLVRKAYDRSCGSSSTQHGLADTTDHVASSANVVANDKRCPPDGWPNARQGRSHATPANHDRIFHQRSHYKHHIYSDLFRVVPAKPEEELDYVPPVYSFLNKENITQNFHYHRDIMDCAPDLVGIVDALARRLGQCEAHTVEQTQQLVLTLRAVSSLGVLTGGLETAVLRCADAAADVVRMAAVRAFKKTCSPAASVELQKRVRDDDELPEVRMAAFESLSGCDHGTADAVAAERGVADENVASYIKTHHLSRHRNNLNFHDSSSSAHPHGYHNSRHLSINLTSLLSIGQLESLLDLKDDLGLEVDLLYDDGLLPKYALLDLKGLRWQPLGKNLKFGFRLNNFEDLAASLLRSSFLANETVRGSSWQGRLLQLLTDVFTGAFGSFFHESSGFPPDPTAGEEPARNDSESGRSKRTLEFDDIRILLEKLFLPSIDFTEFWMEFYRDNDVIRHTYWRLLGTELRQRLSSWRDERIQSVVRGLIAGEVLAVTAAVPWMHLTAHTLPLLGPPLHVTLLRGAVLDVRGHATLDVLDAVSGEKSRLKGTLQTSVSSYSHARVDVVTVGHSRAKREQQQRGWTVEEDDPVVAAVDVDFAVEMENPSTFSINLQFPRRNGLGLSRSKLRRASPLHHHLDLDELQVPAAEVSTNCSKSIRNLANLELCWQAAQADAATPGTSFTASHSSTTLTASEGITGHKVLLSLKNHVRNSVFVDASVTAEGAQPLAAPLHVIAGAVTDLHSTTARLALQGANLSLTYEAGLVYASNLQRIELRSNWNGDEHGVKAELLSVQDGGLTTYKPRLVFSSPDTQEDNLLEGYASVYSSVKEKKLSLDLFTMGSLKENLDLVVRGIVEVKTPVTSAATLALKNVQVSSAGGTVAVDATASLTATGAHLKSEVIFNGEQITLGGRYEFTGGRGDSATLQPYHRDQDSPRHRPVQERFPGAADDRVLARREGIDHTQLPKKLLIKMHFLMPRRPVWSTRLTVACQMSASTFSNNVTLWRGGEGDPQVFAIHHIVAWSAEQMQDSGDVLGRKTSHESHAFLQMFFPSSVQLRLDNTINVTHSPDGWEACLDHSLLLSKRSFESFVVSRLDGSTYKFTTNFYDRTEDSLKLDLEIEMTTPVWRFSYVNSLVQISNTDDVDAGSGDTPVFDIQGHSSMNMPSGRQYRSTTRLRASMWRGVWLLQVLYDTHLSDGGPVWRSVFYKNLEWNSTKFNYEVKLAVDELTVFGGEFTVQGQTESEAGSVVGNVHIRDTFEADLNLLRVSGSAHATARLLLVPSNREIKGSVSMSSAPEGEARLEGALFWDSTRDLRQSFSFVSRAHSNSSSMLMLHVGLDVTGSQWSGDVAIQLGYSPTQLQIINVTLQLPDRSKLEVESSLQLQVSTSDAVLMSVNSVLLPSGNLHELSVEGRGVPRRDGLPDLSLAVKLNSPFTGAAVFRFNFSSASPVLFKEESRLQLEASSEADYWLPLDVAAVWSRRFSGVTSVQSHGVGLASSTPVATVSPHGVRLAVKARLGDQVLALETGGEVVPAPPHALRSRETITKLKAFLDVKGTAVLLLGPQHIRVSVAGHRTDHRDGATHYTGTKLHQTVSVRVDDEDVFRSDGNVTFNMYSTSTGSLNVTQTMPVSLQQCYILEAELSDGVFIARVAGKLNDTAEFRGTIRYKDYEELEVKAQYSGGLALLLEPTQLIALTKLEGIGIGLREEDTSLARRTARTTATLLVGPKRTRVMHVFFWTPEQTSTFLRVSSLYGKKVRLNMTHDNQGPNKWQTVAELQYGQDTFQFEDQVALAGITNFSVTAFMHAPVWGYRNAEALLECSPEPHGVVAVCNIKAEDDVVHGGRLDYSVHRGLHWAALHVALTQFILGRIVMKDYILNYALTNELSHKEVSSNITIGAVPVLELGARVSPDTRNILLGLCSPHTYCFRFFTEGKSETESNIRSFKLKAKAIDNIAWQRNLKPPEAESHFDENDQPEGGENKVVHHSVEFSAVEQRTRAVLIYGGLQRSSCSDVTCEHNRTVGNVSLALDVLPRLGGNVTLTLGGRVMKLALHVASHVDSAYTSDNIDQQQDNGTEISHVPNYQEIYQIRNLSEPTVTSFAGSSAEISSLLKDESDVLLEMISSTLPSSVRRSNLASANLLKLSLWLDAQKFPSDEIVWRTLEAKYLFENGLEYLIQSSITQASMDQDISAKGSFVLRGEEVLVDVQYNLFGDMSNLQRHSLRCWRHDGQYLLSLHTTRPHPSNQNLVLITVKVVPSPDTSNIQITIETPQIKSRPSSSKRSSRSGLTAYHRRGRNSFLSFRSFNRVYDNIIMNTRRWKRSIPAVSLSSREYLDANAARFSCGLNTKLGSYRVECQIASLSVEESFIFSYERDIITNVAAADLSAVEHDKGCIEKVLYGSALHHELAVAQLFCPNMPSLGLKLSYRDADSPVKEAFLQAGVDGSTRASLELFDLAQLDVRLHPPVLLHAKGRAYQDWQGTVQRYQSRLMLAAQQGWQRTADLLHALATDLLPVLHSLRMAPVNNSSTHGGSEVSSVLQLSAYVDSHINDVVDYIHHNQLAGDIHRNLRHSLVTLKSALTNTFGQTATTTEEEQIGRSPRGPGGNTAAVTAGSVGNIAAVTAGSGTYGMLTKVWSTASQGIEGVVISTVLWGQRELLSLQNRVVSLMSEAASETRLHWMAVLNSSVVRAASGTLQEWEAEDVAPWRPVLAALTKTLRSTVAAVHSLALDHYSHHDDTVSQPANNLDILIPLPFTTYSLQEFLRYVNPFHRSSQQDPTSYQRATYQRLGSSQPTSTWSLLKNYIRLLTNPTRLYKQLVPPYPMYGVLFYPYLFVSFKGEVYILEEQCADLILFAHDLHRKKVIIHYGKHSRSEARTYSAEENVANVHNGELTAIINQDTVIRINTNELFVNNKTISLPYTAPNSLTVLRDLSSITVILHDTPDAVHGTKVTCADASDTCIVFADDWVAATARVGLLPMKTPASHQDGIARSCSAIPELHPNMTMKYHDHPLIDIDMTPATAAEMLCRKLVLPPHSPYASCRQGVQSGTFYKACVMQLRAHRSRNPYNFSQRTEQRKKVKPFTSKKSYNLYTSTQVSDEDLDLICAVVWAYGRVCAYKNAATVPEEATLCEQYSLNQRDIDIWHRNDYLSNLSSLPHTGDVASHADSLFQTHKLGDMLVLVESAECLNSSYYSVLQYMTKLFEEETDKKHIDLKLGLVRYGSDSSSHALVHHTHHSSALLGNPHQQVLSFAGHLKDSRFACLSSQSDATSTDSSCQTPDADDLAYFGLSSAGGLHEAVVTSLRYPYRTGSARVVIIFSCTVQDIRTFSPALVEEFRSRNVVVFYTSPHMLLSSEHEQPSPRYTIGVDRFWLYRLHGAQMHLTDTWGVQPPETNIARLAVYSGGGVFSSASLSHLRIRPRQYERQLKLYRTVLAATVINRMDDIALSGN